MANAVGDPPQPPPCPPSGRSPANQISTQIHNQPFPDYSRSFSRSTECKRDSARVLYALRRTRSSGSDVITHHPQNHSTSGFLALEREENDPVKIRASVPWASIFGIFGSIFNSILHPPSETSGGQCARGLPTMSGNNSNHHNTESHTLIENEAEEQSKNDGITSKAGILHQRCMS